MGHYWGKRGRQSEKGALRSLSRWASLTGAMVVSGTIHHFPEIKATSNKEIPKEIRTSNFPHFSEMELLEIEMKSNQMKCLVRQGFSKDFQLMGSEPFRKEKTTFSLCRLVSKC